jgi:hypothetical protein
MNRIISALFLTITLFSSCVLAQESPTQEVIGSKAYSDLSRNIKKPKDKFPHWVNPNGSYIKIFSLKKGTLLIGDWLGKPQEFRAGDPYTSHTPDAVRFLRKFLYNKILLTVEVVLPIPTLVEAAQFKLIKDVLEFDSPALSINNEEEIPLNGDLKATFVQYNKSKCGLRMRLPRQGVMFISSAECGDKTVLTKLADQLSIKLLLDRLSD